MSEELKPCERCGENTLVVCSAGSQYIAKCSKSYCSGSGGFFSDKQDAIDDVNTRPIEDTLNQRIAELEREIATTLEYIAEDYQCCPKCRNLRHAEELNFNIDNVALDCSFCVEPAGGE